MDVRIAVLSDVHSNLPALDAVLAEARAEEADGYVVCGDIVGYGADPDAVIERIFDLPLHSVVAGNHDLAATDRFPIGWFNAAAAEAIRWTAEQCSPEHLGTLRGLEPRERARVGLVVHGSVVAPAEEYLFPWEEAAATNSFDRESFEVCLFGHTHVPTIFERDSGGSVRGRAVEGSAEMTLDPGRRYLLNPGSVGQPRDRDPRAAFLMLDTEGGGAAWRRVAYDVEAAQTKIREAGLPRVLADRLELGA